ncbi:FAD-dependent oxidoreductase [Gulosibacter molinativorax]|uniref:ferredoxin--NADP(+) reductase n=1 Tax=Gulosibacter molinativorax TaxID=256821 RepID=A0ABT7C4E2_9MICO|nr:FAD-dependent oxidoreductase [Gulosibacter molinativorax]MDJ1370084.1 hypothetical protein [Gulosibacter molinativorax]QUY63723.1 Oxidoreductase [Gulosibacter molinativorax]
MSNTPPKHIAIIGSGPSGCFVAQSLQRAWKDSEITVFDRFAVPYGLIRYGVAADHQHTKAITRQFDRMFADGSVRFAGNVEIGTDISLAQLRERFDLVILASGRWRDRHLSVPGSSLKGVIPSGDIINALNAVPRPSIPLPEIGERVVVVGAGNVAIDMVRFLVKTAADYAGSDVAPGALEQYLAAPASAITVLSRSPIATAKADVAMVKELGKIAGVRYTFANSSPATEDNALGRKREDAFAALAEIEVDEPRAHVHFVFGAEPSKVTGAGKVEQVHLGAAPVGEASVIPADTVISAIGFDANAPGHLNYAEEFDFTPAEESGKVDEGLYRVGWLKRGPVGAIPANRADSNVVAKEILAAAESGELTASLDRGGFESLPESLRAQSVSFAAWQKIDAAETAAAETDRIRTKLLDHEAMLDIAHS